MAAGSTPMARPAARRPPTPLLAVLFGWLLWAPADTRAAPALGERFGTEGAVRRAALEVGAAQMAGALGPGLLEAESRVAIEAGPRAHHQSDRVRLEWDAARGMTLQHTCGGAPLELWRVGDGLFVRIQRGPMRQKTSRDMDADALFDQAHSTFAQALAYLAPLRYSEGAAQTHNGRPAWHYRVEVASAPPDERPPPAPEGRPGTRPALWRQNLGERQVQGFVVVDDTTGIVVRGSLRAVVTVLHPAAPTAKVTLEVDHHVSARRQTQRLAAPPAVNEFRRRLHSKDPIAFYRQPTGKPRARPGTPAAQDADEEVPLEDEAE